MTSRSRPARTDRTSATFVRAATGPGDEPWTFTEDDLPGWRRTSETCVSQTGASRATTDVVGGAAAVTLAAGDTVTCTIVNAVQPPASGLTLSKPTLGGVGAFPFTVNGPDDASQTLTTRQEGVAVSGDRLALEAGQYRLDESLPDGPSGRWAVDDVSCDGRSLGDQLPLTLTLPSGEGRACLVTNRFTPAGSITLRKTTLGATGTAGFVIDRDRVDADGATWRQRATTNAEGVAVRATGDDTSALPLGRYEIVETGLASRADGSWALDSVVSRRAAGRQRARSRRDHADGRRPRRRLQLHQPLHEHASSRRSSCRRHRSRRRPRPSRRAAAAWRGSSRRTGRSRSCRSASASRRSSHSRASGSATRSSSSTEDPTRRRR